MQAEFDLNPIPDLDALEAKLKLNRKTIRDFFSKRRRECGIEGRIETRKPTFGGGNNGGGRGRDRGRGAAKAGGGGAGRGSGKRLLADLDFDHDWTPGRPKRAKADTTPGVYTVDQVGDDDLLVEDDDGDSAFAEDSYAEHDASAYYGEYDGGDDIKPETATLPFHSPLVANHPVPAAVASAPLPSARPHDTHTYTNSTALPSQQTEAMPSGAPLAEAPGPAQPEQTLAIAAAQAMPIEPEANDQAQKPRKYTYANSYFLPTDMLIGRLPLSLAMQTQQADIVHTHSQIRGKPISLQGRARSHAGRLHFHAPSGLGLVPAASQEQRPQLNVRHARWRWRTKARAASNSRETRTRRRPRRRGGHAVPRRQLYLPGQPPWRRRASGEEEAAAGARLGRRR